MQKAILPLCLIVLLSACTRVDGIHVKLFKDLNFKGLIYEYKEKLSECHNVEPYAQGEIGSVITDTCLMVYEGSGCAGNSFKLSRDLPDLNDLRRVVKSFHPCTAEYGGDKIRVDMYDNQDKLIAEYYDICGCQDLPSQVSLKVTKLKNYGNCVTVYASGTCSGNETMDIPGGQNGYSQNLPQLGYYVRSLSACGTRRACVTLKSRITKFKLIPNPSRAAAQSIAQNVDLGTKTYFYNNGSATLTQEYEAKRTVRETTTMKMSKTISSMSSFEVDAGAEVEVGTGEDEDEDECEEQRRNGRRAEEEDKCEDKDITIKLQGKLSGSLSKAYSTESPPETEEYSYTHEEETTFSVKQRFQVPPCVQYEVSSTISMVENYPVIYEVYAMITGESSGAKMTAEEVAGQVDEMTFVEYFDEYTAIFKRTETMTANLGVETIISGGGSDLPGCDKRTVIEA